MKKHGNTCKNMEKHEKTWKYIGWRNKMLKYMEKHGKTWKNI